jgi:ferredoxin
VDAGGRARPRKDALATRIILISAEENVKIVVDHDKCSGHALCRAAEPSLYTLDEAGYSDISERAVPQGMAGVAAAGREACPESAITLIE